MKALKRFGQNFLIDNNILLFIVSHANISPDDCILEIGPGHGVLTKALLEHNPKCIHSIEIDERFKPELETLALSNNRLVLHWGDAVKYDYSSLSPFPNKVIANIPYNITTPLIWELLKFAHKGLKYFLLMLQKDAALRIIAPSHSKSRYPLGVCIEAMGYAKILRSVNPQCFRPVPKVDSAITEIALSRNLDLPRYELWSDLLHKGFAHRRKVLANNLKDFDIPEELARKRAEDLSCDEWLELFSPALEANAEEI